MSGPRRWFSAFLPSARETVSANVRFLDPEALARPAAALDLVAKEQLAVAQGLPQYLDAIREDTRAQATASAETQHRTTLAVLKQIKGFTTALGDPAHLTERVSQLGERTELLAMLGDTIRELADTMRAGLTSTALAALMADMAEALHVVLLSAIDAMESPDEHNLEVLHHLTAGRSRLMDDLRRSLLRGEHTLTVEEHQALFTSTRLFERVILLLRQLQTGLAQR